MKIRQYTKEDIPQLIKMRFDFTAETYATNPDTYDDFEIECRAFLEETIESNRWYVWVADVEGLIVSHTFLEIIDTVPRPGRRKSPYGFITNVYTIPEYRSQGIGGKILKIINEWSKETGLTFLTVWPSEASTEFYRRHGFDKSKEMMENFLK
jgi:GNAT superfamily N-acetyltransferase